MQVVPTRAALQFVGEPTWAALSGHPVHTDVWQDVHEVPHVRLGREADLVVVAPATADLLARAAHGLADDLLTNTLLTARCPVLMAPAMHTEMWQHPATQANVATLRDRGVHVLDPASGRLTGADTGPGRLPEPERDLRGLPGAAGAAPPSSADLAGRTVLVTAGGTREPLDPVRFLGNRSSGKQGYAIAAVAAARGARGRPGQHLVAARPGRRAGGAGRDRRADARAVLAEAPAADVVVMAAAVADFRPATSPTTRSRRRTTARRPPIELVRNPDILAEVAAHRTRPGQVVVGFAAETGDATADVLDYARAKLARKGCDLLVVNEVGADKTFGADHNTVVVLDAGRRRAPDRARDEGRRGGRCLEYGHRASRSASRLESSDRGPRPSGPPASSRCTRGEHCVVPAPVHVRVRHRGAPGQDL